MSRADKLTSNIKTENKKKEPMKIQLAFVRDDVNEKGMNDLAKVVKVK